MRGCTLSCPDRGVPTGWHQLQSEQVDGCQGRRRVQRGAHLAEHEAILLRGGTHCQALADVEPSRIIVRAVAVAAAPLRSVTAALCPLPRRVRAARWQLPYLRVIVNMLFCWPGVLPFGIV